MSKIKQREIIVNHRYIDGEIQHCFDNDNYTLLELERQVYINENERLNNIIEDFEIELQREVNIREEDTGLEHNTFITINNTLKTTLKRFRELIGSDKE